ncbi:MAG: helix-turn-helix transcriptional regulator [Oscillospiraceae bacterium]|nr:helix-turn-helix transcriptional regulator [Oscillospiraceae bacterium]
MREHPEYCNSTKIINEIFEEQDEENTLPFYMNKYMKKFKYTRDELATLLDVDLKTIDNYITGKRSRPQKYETALRMCIVFDLPRKQAEQFLSDIGYPKGYFTTEMQKIHYAYVTKNPRDYKRSIDTCNRVFRAFGGEEI